MPYVIETVGRRATAPLLAFLVDAYDEDEAEGEARVVLRLASAARARQGGRASRS